MQAIFFLLDTLLGFFTLLLLARFFMQLNRVSFANQLGHFVVQLTDWLVKPVRRFVPGLFGLDLACLLPAWWIQCLFLVAILSIRGLGAMEGQSFELAMMILWRGGVATVRLGVYLFIASLFLQAALSWINPHSPLASPVAQMNRPLLQPIQRFLPLVANIDLSPLVAIVLLQVLLLLL
ncbi:MAG: YggT family protein [Zoogloeaceae bacterium]|nr:YggT family protein [Zoogloeaceae bacterium]